MKNIVVTITAITAAQLLAVATALADSGAQVDEHHSCGTGCGSAEFNEAQATPATDGASLSDIGLLLELLSDPRYELRSAKALIHALDKAFPNDGFEDYTADTLKDFLYVFEVAFYTKRRRSDGETMIGLVKAPVVEVKKFAVGDKVVVVKRVDEESGWDNVWSNDMDTYVGNGTVYTINRVNEAGVYIGGLYGFPHGALAAAPVEVVAPEGRADDKFANLMELLEDTRYTYRTMATVLSKTGYANREALLEDLEDNGVDIEYANRNSDGAEMIGLSSRV